MTDGNSALWPTPTRVETQSFGQNEQQQVQIGGPQPPLFALHRYGDSQGGVIKSRARTHLYRTSLKWQKRRLGH